MGKIHLNMKLQGHQNTLWAKNPPLKWVLAVSVLLVLIYRGFYGDTTKVKVLIIRDLGVCQGSCVTPKGLWKRDTISLTL